MSALVALPLAMLLASLLERRRRGPGLDLDALVLGAATWLAAVGIIATGLAMIERFGPVSMSAATGVLAVIVWPRGKPSPPRRPWPARRWAQGLLVLLIGLGLRWPVADYALAGRDQGTYTLRAQHTLREGRLDAHDPILAQAGHPAVSRPGPADVLGLFHHDRTPWRQGRYEAAYRPGFYLADIDTGHVRAQFFHLHPMLMATAGMIFGPQHVAAIVPLYAALAILALWAAARRLWRVGPWPWLAALGWILSPLAIWVQRSALSEGLATVFVLAALVAVLRARDDHPQGLSDAALLLGANAWVRGNGWLVIPVILAAQWLVPRGDRSARRAGLLYVAMVGSAVVVHVLTTFPYLHDELLRQLPLTAVPPTPAMIIGATAVGFALWWALGTWGPPGNPRPRWSPVVMRWAPWVLTLIMLVGIAVFIAQRPEPLARPFSRLDPVAALLGPLSLGLAAVGLVVVVRRWRPPSDAAGAWQVGLAAIVTVTVLLYAQRNLPQLGLYYYGRYLVPELLPALLLLAVEGLRVLHTRVTGPIPSRSRRRWTGAVGLLGAGALLWSMASVLVLHPVTRLTEFEGADRVVDHLAEQLPAEAVVIAGGEGWHSGHTFNQVGGALAFRHGIPVLPYRTREAAYATLYELLVALPRARGIEAPPVFLLLNEATKHHTRIEDDGKTKTRVAGLDDLLPPPFVARRVDLVEMFINRLSPTHEGAPTRVTRDGLRMALLRVEVDPHRWASVERWRLRVQRGEWAVDGPPGLVVEGGQPQRGTSCLGDEPLTLQLPADSEAVAPVSVVLVAAPGTAAINGRWRVAVDGSAVGLDPPQGPSRHRDTLGPFTFTGRPQTIEIRGAEAAVGDGPCPHGALQELRVLGPDAPALATAETTATTFAPTLSLGHPVTPVAWLSARGLSRLRPGVGPSPQVQGLSLVITPDGPLRFPEAVVADAGQHPIDVVVTLTHTQLSPDARLLVTVGGVALPPIDPPDERRGSWQSPALRWRPSSATAAIEVRLDGAAPGDSVSLRDIGLFSRAAPVPGRLVLQ